MSSHRARPRSTTHPPHLAMVGPVRGVAFAPKRRVSFDFSKPAYERVLELGAFEGIPPAAVVRNALRLYECAWQTQRAGGKIYVEQPTVCFKLELPIPAPRTPKV